jgi:hypothetical protein
MTKGKRKDGAEQFVKVIYYKKKHAYNKIDVHTFTCQHAFDWG